MKIYYGRFRFQCCLTFIERFKQKDNMISTSAITAFTNSSMKSGSGATQIVTYAVVEKRMENKGE